MRNTRSWPSRLANLAVIFAAAAVFSASARAAPLHAAMVIDANTGDVLHSHAGDEPRHPASLTKMMTLYIVFDLIEQKRLSYKTRIKISEAAAAVAPSKLGIDPGGDIALSDAIKALVVKSANDVAVAIAEDVAGTEDAFARIMTARAREIGMTATTFKNASGLPDPEQVTTARDMLTLAIRLQDDFPKHYGLFSTRAFAHGSKNYRNHNTLLRSFKGADGIKTGYTRASGFNLVSSARRDGKHLVGVIFGGHSAAIRNANMRLLLNNALAKASAEKTREKTAFTPLTLAPRPVHASAPARPRPKPAPPAVVAEAELKTDAARPTVATAPPPEATPANAIPVAKVRQVKLKPKAVASAEKPAVFATAGASAGPSLTSPARAKAIPEPAAAKPPPATQGATAEKKVAAIAPQPGKAANAAPVQGAAGPTAFHIQIGAFGSVEEAEQRLGAARERAGGLLDGHPSMTQLVKKGAGQLYRARFSGFDSPSATVTCAELKKHAIDCYVAKGE